VLAYAVGLAVSAVTDLPAGATVVCCAGLASALLLVLPLRLRSTPGNCADGGNV
jgi:ABC-type Mn2+/Zn2+ transport system permease subunit